MYFYWLNSDQKQTFLVTSYSCLRNVTWRDASWYVIAGFSAFGLWNEWIVTSERVTRPEDCWKGWVGRDEGYGRVKLNCLLPLSSFIHWSACWALLPTSATKNGWGHCNFKPEIDLKQLTLSLPCNEITNAFCSWVRVFCKQWSWSSFVTHVTNSRKANHTAAATQ
jgi:hypothetical protein